MTLGSQVTHTAPPVIDRDIRHLMQSITKWLAKRANTG
jgi:hypothetical protein